MAMSKPMRRSDKHVLGGGDQLIFAPAHPQFLEVPGFWDTLTFDYAPVPQSFSLSFFDQKTPDKPLDMEPGKRSWLPHSLSATYQVPSHQLTVRESREISPDNKAISKVQLTNKGPKPLQLIISQWGMQDIANAEVSYWRDGDRIFIEKIFPGRRTNQRKLRFCLGGDALASEVMVRRSRTGVRAPRWLCSPFYESGFIDDPALLQEHLPNFDGSIFYQRSLRLTLKPEQERTLIFYADFEDSIPQDERQQRASVLRRPQTAEESWTAFFEGLPTFQCSDPHLQHYWTYRYATFKLLLNPGSLGYHRYPGVAEGIGFFHTLISYSTQVIVRDLRWHADAELAKGCLRNFFAAQRPDGSFPGRIYQETLENADFYHADWGSAALAVYETSHDLGFLAEAYAPIARYVAYFEDKRDFDHSKLFDIWNHFETGQEFSSRYTAVNPDCDRDDWEDNLRMKGVDVTVYIYCTVSALETMAHLLGKTEDIARWRTLKTAIRQSMLTRMWSSKDGFFSDLDGKGQRTGVASFTNFYPYLTDIIGKDHLPALKQHLFNPEEFWSPYPVTTLSMRDPMFSAEPYWKGKRRYCPWNGRVWPMTNSHAVELLANVADNLDSSVTPYLERLLLTFIHMMCFESDPTRPNCFEHYNPMTGKACIYRGVDDYAHSWVTDLLIKYLVGFRPRTDGSYMVKPLIGADLTWSLRGLRYAGRTIDLIKSDKTIEVRQDGKFHHRCPAGTTSLFL